MKQKMKKSKTKVKKSTKEKVLITLFSIVIVISVLSVAAVFVLNSRFFLNKDGDISGGLLTSEITTPNDIAKKSVNFLVCGIDYEEGTSRGKLTDVIMLVNFDIEAKKINILQIPRDSYIGEDYPTGKINAIYGQSKNGGVEGLAKRINKTFNITIDHYVTITMDGFVAAVDTIGGVEVDVPKEINLEGYHIKPGLQKLDGKHAEIFVRERKSYPNGDFGRMEMQKVFLKALLNKMFSVGANEVIGLLPTLMNDITTDMTIGEMIGFYNNLTNVDKTNGINFHVLPVISAARNGLSMQSIKKYPTADLLNEYFRPHTDPVPAEELGILELNTNYEYTSSSASSDSSK